MKNLINLTNFAPVFVNKIRGLPAACFSGLLSLIYKDGCVICGCSKDDAVLCKSCAKTVEFLSPFAHSMTEGVEIFSAFIYDGVVKKLVQKLKFSHKKTAAGVLAEFLAKYFKRVLDERYKERAFNDWFKNTVVVPVPTNRSNVFKRGYNNVTEIAERLCDMCGGVFADDILIKVRDTKPQFKLRVRERKSNVEGCFGVNIKKLVKYYKKFSFKNILIVDDIVTTGATLDEAVKAVRQGLKTASAVGFKEIGGGTPKEKFNNINIVCLTVAKADLRRI